MTSATKWINRTAIAMLAAVSVSAFAAAPDAPDYLMHQASVNFKVSSQGNGNIESDTYKTKNLINLLMGRSVDAKNEKDEKLGLVTGCDAEEDDVALVVYDKKTEEIKNKSDGTMSDNIIIDIEDEVFENDNEGNLKKSDLLAFVSESDGFLIVTGTTKYGKIDRKCAKDGDDKDHWDKDSICAKGFNSKSIAGTGLFGEVVMSGKINAGSCKFAADSGIFPRVTFAISKNASAISNGLDVVTAVGDIIDYDIKVTNLNDNQNATGVVVTDLHPDATVDCPDNTVNAGASMDCTASLTVSQATWDNACDPDDGTGTIGNIATVTADKTDSFAANEFVNVDCFAPVVDGLAIVKTDDTVAPVYVDDTITYTITVTNQSGVAQTGVTVADTMLATLDCGADDAAGTDLPDGESMTCIGSHTVSLADVESACGERDGTIRNVASTTSDDLDSFEADDLVAVNCFYIAVSKSPDIDFVAIEDTVITYTIDIVNLGTEAQTGVVVSDLNDGVQLDCGGVDTLAAQGDAGDSFSCTGTLTATAAVMDEACLGDENIHNVATVTSNEAPATYTADALVGVGCPRS